MKPCRTNSKTLCSRATCDICKQRSFASHERSREWSNRNLLTPRDVFKSADKKYWFDCRKCGHEYQLSPAKITGRDIECCYCTNARLCNNNNCGHCYQRSFESSEFVYKWSHKNLLTPRQVRKGSGELYIFNCNCGHEYTSRVDAIKSTCLYCCKKSKVFCNNEDCAKCNAKSFISNPKSEFWDFERNAKPPWMVAVGTAKKYWFKCSCGHSFDAALNNIKSANQWCPYCSQPASMLCSDENCESCSSKSLANSFLATQWDYEKNSVKPRDVFRNTHDKYWFKCECGKSRQVQPSKATIVSCESCNETGYSKVCIRWLEDIMKEQGIYIQHAKNDGEFQIPNTKYWADGYCKETNTIYEFHGTEFHGDPEVCKPEDFNFYGRNYGELYANTMKKEQTIRDLGYNLIVMWERNYKGK